MIKTERWANRLDKVVKRRIFVNILPLVNLAPLARPSVRPSVRPSARPPVHLPPLEKPLVVAVAASCQLLLEVSKMIMRRYDADKGRKGRWLMIHCVFEQCCCQPSVLAATMVTVALGGTCRFFILLFHSFTQPLWWAEYLIECRIRLEYVLQAA